MVQLQSIINACSRSWYMCGYGRSVRLPRKDQSITDRASPVSGSRPRRRPIELGKLNASSVLSMSRPIRVPAVPSSIVSTSRYDLTPLRTTAFAFSIIRRQYRSISNCGRQTIPPEGTCQLPRTTRDAAPL